MLESLGAATQVPVPGCGSIAIREDSTRCNTQPHCQSFPSLLSVSEPKVMPSARHVIDLAMSTHAACHAWISSRDTRQSAMWLVCASVQQHCSILWSHMIGMEHRRNIASFSFMKDTPQVNRSEVQAGHGGFSFGRAKQVHGQAWHLALSGGERDRGGARARVEGKHISEMEADDGVADSGNFRALCSA